jgi:hypothetical protein
MIENLSKLLAAKVTFQTIPGFDITEIEVTDLDLWRSHINQLLSLFGKVIFEEYEREPFDITDPDVTKRALHQLQISFNDIDRLYVLMESDKFIGLIAVKTYKEQPKIGVVIEIIVDPMYRGKKIALKLYELVFKTNEYNAIFGYSRFPAAVKARYDVGKQYGYTTYFGEVSKENHVVRDLQHVALEYFTGDGIVSRVEAPQGFMFLKGEENVNSPLQEGEAKFEKTDPLSEPFHRILEIQKVTDKDTAVGILISLLE